MKYIVCGGVALLVLSVAKGLLPDFLLFLPLGGSTISEMGIVFGLAVAAATIDDLRRKRDE